MGTPSSRRTLFTWTTSTSHTGRKNRGHAKRVPPITSKVRFGASGRDSQVGFLQKVLHDPGGYILNRARRDHCHSCKFRQCDVRGAAALKKLQRVFGLARAS